MIGRLADVGASRSTNARSPPWRVSFAPAAIVILLALGSLAFAPSVVTASAPQRAPVVSLGHPLLNDHPAAGASPTAASGLPPARGESPTTARSALSVHIDPSAFRGTHPAAWGAAGVPPGAPVPNGAALPSIGASAGTPTTSPWLNHGNLGCWSVGPDNGTNSQYLAPCYGHDEPNINFYSNLPGSGGNVTWNVTLPTDRNATANQSDLYVAIWFGMTLQDPFAWMDQCFLELQFYPDQTWTNGPGLPNPALTVNGAWVGEAVAWQIEALTGFEDPCFIQPLYLNDAAYGAGNGSFLNMTQGDRVSVTMEGWAASPYGEDLTIHDLTNGAWSNLTMFNSVQNYPLDPAYTTNTYENGLQWTPGGEYPVSFAFETGHTASTFPGNNTYGGCSPGAPPSTPVDPAAPCPSYDPGSWINDTARPWHIDPPVFFDGASVQHPTQVGFGQDLGGIGFIDYGPGFPTCLGREGSAWCSYPWYSYSCAQKTFYFGATDYPGAAIDFGKYRQFTTVSTANAAGWGYYAPTNFTLPTCGGTSATATVATGGGGWVNFLSTPVVGSTQFNGLGFGVYSIHGLALGANGFEHWTTTGAVSVGDDQGAYTTLVVAGNGTVTAVFGPAPPLTRVTFASAVPSAQCGVAPSYQFGFLGSSGRADLATLAVGGAIDLAPGIYAIQAYPPAGYNFSSWSSNDSAAVVASWGFPVTDLVITADSPSATVTATFVASLSNASLAVEIVGNGTVTFNGTPIPEYSPTFGFVSGVVVPVGSYPLVSVPGPNWTFSNVYYGSNAVMTNFTNDTWVNVENASSIVEVVFSEIPGLPVNVTFNDSPAADGQIALYGALVLPNGAQSPVPTGVESALAVPNATFEFISWTVNNTSALWVLTPFSADATVIVNASGTLVANYAPFAPLNLSFGFSPAVASGVPIHVVFNFNSVYTNGGSNTTLTYGLYSFYPVAPPGWFLASEYTTGNVSIAGSGFVFVYGPVGGSLNLTFAQIPAAPWPVTFLAEPLGTLTGTINGTAVASGGTVWLDPGTYPLDAVPGATNASFLDWTVAGGVAVAQATNGTTTITVVGGGSVEAVGANFSASAVLATPDPVDVGNATQLSITIAGAPGASVAWSGLPPGCSAGNVTTVSCTPTAAGLYAVGAVATIADGETARAAAAALSVVAGPAISAFTASPASLTVNTPLRLTATEAGGIGPLSWAYTGLPAGCTSVNGPTVSCSPTATGTTVVTVRVTDAFANSVTATTQVQVNPVPTLTAFTVTPSVVTVGVTTNFSFAVAGGTAPFAFAFGSSLPAGCPSPPPPGPTSTAFPCTPTHAGTFVVNGTATDLSGVAVHAQVTLTVNGAPTITSFTTSATSFALGGSTTFSVIASGGTGALGYTYAQLPAGCTSVNAAQFTCKPTQTGTYNVSVTVKDIFGVAATAATSLTVTKASTPPGPSPSGGFSNLDYGIIALVAALVVIGIVAAAWSRRKKPPAPEAWDAGSAAPSPPPDAGGGATPPGPN